MVLRCKSCSKELHGSKTKFCSRYCSNKWRLIKFREKNPDTFNKLMMDGYKRNKDKWNSRSATAKILNGNGKYKHFNPLQKKCKCGSVDNLEIHHEEYPTIAKEIRQAILDGKIYYKCRKCHGKGNKHNSSKAKF